MKIVKAAPLGAIWGVLVLATLLSYGSSIETTVDPRIAGSAILAIAFFKVHLIGERFMEIGKAPWSIRLPFTLWLVVLLATLLTIFALTKAIPA